MKANRTETRIIYKSVSLPLFNVPFTPLTASCKLCSTSELLANFYFYHIKANLSATSLQGLSKLVSLSIHGLQESPHPKGVQLCPEEKPFPWLRKLPLPQALTTLTHWEETT